MPDNDSDTSLDDLGDWRRTKYLSRIQEGDYDTEMNIAGWVQDIRKLGGISFLQLRDRTDVVQVTAIKEEMNDDTLFDKLSNLPRESVVGFRALIRQSEQVKKGFEAIPLSMKVFSLAKTPLPLGVIDKVFADMDTRLDNRYLDLRKHSVTAIFSIRNAILKASRESLEQEDFFEINTPKIVATATEGGTDLFPIKYFETDAYLNQSPQLYKQIMMSAGFDRVFEIGPAFRAEKHNTVRHINEFISIDIEMSFANEEDCMQVLERMIKAAFERVVNDHSQDVASVNEFLTKYNKHLEIENNKIRQDNKKLKHENKQAKKQGLPRKPLQPLREKLPVLELSVPDVPFPRLTYDEAYDLVKEETETWNKRNPQDIREVMEYGEDFPQEACKSIANRYPGLYFTVKWPTKIKPFYIQPFEDNPEYARGFDLMYGEKELTSGGQRVHDLPLLRSRLKDQGLDPDECTFYLDAFEYGMPPHAGGGLGLERTAMMLTGVYNIRETILFPRDRNRVVP